MDTSWLPKTYEILKNFYELNPFPYMAMGAWTLFAIWYVRKAFKEYEKINRYLLQLIPFVFTALGLLGAVAASLGFVWGFTPDDLLSGSEQLFKGLLGAATTAIVGIALSMIFGKLISMTHYKVEMRKALENNELFVLKKMLKLLLKGYAKGQHNVGRTLKSLDGVRSDVRDLGPDLDRNAQQLQQAIVAALKGEQDAPISVQITRMRQELSRHSELLVQQGARQNELLERIAEALDGEQEYSLSNQLANLRAEQHARGTTLESSLGAVFESVQRLDTKAAAESVRIAISDQGKAVTAGIAELTEAQQDYASDRKQADEALLQALASMEQAHTRRLDALTEQQKVNAVELAEAQQQAAASLLESQTRMQQAHAARLDELEQLQRDSTHELASRQEAHARVQQQALEGLEQLQRDTARELEQTQQKHARTLEDILARNRRQARELAALARQLDPAAGDALPARLQELQAGVQALTGSEDDRHEALLAQLHRQGELLEQTRSTLLDELASQQATAAADAARQAAVRFSREFEPMLGQAVAALQDRLDTMAAEQARAARDSAQELVAHAASEAANQAGAQIAKRAADDLRRHQAGQFGGLSRQLQELGGSLKRHFERIDSLGARTDSLASDTAALKEMLQHTVQARRSMKDITSILEQVAPGSDNGRAEATSGLEDAMQQLVQRLRQVDAIKKNDVKFWRQVERQMHDGIPIIMGGNKLNLSDDLNGSFQDRLQRSFSNLDRILQTIVSGYQSRSGGLQ